MNKTFAALALSLPLFFALIALAPLAHAASINLGSSNNTQQTTGASLGGSDNTKPPTGTQSQDSGSNVSLMNPLSSGSSLPGLIQELLGFVVKIGTVIIILMVVYVGFKFVMAQGEPSALSEARQALLWTVVGALILLGAQAIATAIQATATAL